MAFCSATRLRHRRITGAIVLPRQRGSTPISYLPSQRHLNVQHLQQKLQGGAAQLNARLQRGNAQPSGDWARASSTASACSSLGMEAVAKYSQMARSSRPGRSRTSSVDGASSGSANLLVVAYRRRRRAQVHNKTQIRLYQNPYRGRSSQQAPSPGSL